MTINAKEVLKDKFWIVEQNGEKLGTLKFITDNHYEYFITKTNQTVTLTQAEFKKQFKVVNTINKGTFVDVYGYSTNCEDVYNVRTEDNVPIFTKTVNSQNYHCAGWYAIYFPSIKWSSAYCPRLKTLKSYPFIGPFKTEEDVNLAIKRKRYEKTDSNNSNSTVIN